MHAFRYLRLIIISMGLLWSCARADVLGTRVVQLDAWKSPNAEQIAITSTPSAEQSPASVRFDLRVPNASWVVLNGPEISVGARTQFHHNRRVRISVEVRTEQLEGYAMQIRLRQRKGDQTTGGAYTRNVSPRLLWDSAFELNNAETCRTWTELEGVSTVAQGTEKLVVELWLTTPYGKAPASIELRNLRITELAEIEHVISSEVPGNIFFGDAGSMHANFVAPEKLESCRIELLDEHERVTGLVEGSKGTASLDIVLPGRGYYTVRASAEYGTGKPIVAATTAAVVGPPLSAEVRQNSRFGSMIVWANRNLWEKSGANWDWGIGGIDLSKYELRPDGTIVPPPGYKPLRPPEGYQTILTIGEFPKWVMPDGYTRSSLMAPKDWDLFERLLEAFARANPDLPWFCPFNEPDAHWRGSKADLVRFHQAIKAGVKRGNPAMKVFGPCFYSIRMDDFRQYADMGLLDAFDGLVMHAYVDGSEPEGKFITNVVGLVDYLRSTGHGDMPIYITEYGWCAVVGDWQKTVTELDRSRYAARSLALMGAQPFDAIAYFCFKHTSTPFAPGYSLVYSDNTPTPTYVAFVNTLGRLSWTQRGDGRWFRLSPSQNLVVFSRDGRNACVAWDKDGVSKLKLPSVPTALVDTMGRPIHSGDSAEIQIGPDPVYFELTDAAALAEAETLPTLILPPGADYELPFSDGWAVPGIAINGRKVAVANDAPPGDYLVMHTADGVIRVQPIRVSAALDVEAIDFKLSPDGKRLLAVASVSTPITNGATVKLKLTLSDGTKSEAEVVLNPGSPSRVEAQVPGFEFGKRYQGTFELSLIGSVPFKLEQPFDQTITLCPALAESGATLDWSASTQVDFSNWSPYPKPILADDCSATMRTLVTPEAFHLRVDVTDDIHYQNQLASYMWNADSIQFALDLDASKEWQPNNIGNGHQGHRIFEYIVGLPTKGGKSMVWRSRVDAPGFTANSEEPRLIAKVTREGNRTLYDITLPWSAVGLQKAPAAGPNLGFALVVNDTDGSAGKRKALRLFKGILEGKDPKGFGKLYLVPQS
jgi:hypothetical protein